jgi:ribosomal-protein-alanine N-acetyltransferase
VAFIVRDFQLEHLETLWRIDQECFPPGISYSRQELKFYVRRRGAITLVAASNPDKSHTLPAPEVAGFIVAHPGNTGHIVTIDVVASARRSGVGSLLLRSAEDRLRSAGSRAVALETAVDNISALAFYKRHGYNVVKTIPRYYSNGVDALVLQKELA